MFLINKLISYSSFFKKLKKLEVVYIEISIIRPLNFRINPFLPEKPYAIPPIDHMMYYH